MVGVTGRLGKVLEKKDIQTRIKTDKKIEKLQSNNDPTTRLKIQGIYELHCHCEKI